jgi:hypothetical protein
MNTMSNSERIVNDRSSASAAMVAPSAIAIAWIRKNPRSFPAADDANARPKR